MAKIVVQPVADELLLHRCLAIRNEVFVVEKKVPKELEVDEQDVQGSACEHFLIQFAGTDVGATRCFHVSKDTIQIQRFCCLKNYRKQGVGKTALRYIEEYYKDRGMRIIELDSKYDVCEFYEKSGYEIVSDVFMEANVEHVKMKKFLFS